LKEHWTNKIMNYVLLTLVMLFILFPFFWLAVSSVKSKEEIFAKVPTLYIQHFTWDHYVWMISAKGGNLLPYLSNSILITSVSMVVTMLCALTAGYALGRYKFPGLGLFVLLLFITQMFQGPLIMIPWYKMASILSIIDTKLVLILIYGTITIPIAVFMMSGFFRTVPRELEEAAYIDGCNKLQILYKVSFPLILPGMVAVSIFSFILAWNDYQYALILTSSAKAKTVQVLIMEYVQTVGNIDWGGILAGSVIITLPVVILFGFTQRYLIDGLTAGGVKG